MPQPAKRPLDQSTIEVKVKSQDGRQLYFRINRSTPLQRLLVAYCQRINLDYKTMQFVYNGNRVTAKQTPEQLGMEDGEEIDALTHQMGGGCRAF
ncbi:small ubiquitin-related modifier 2-like [Vitis riparia]|uniref:small ubiquitin-related modifier 2-like n=1 Tax=Vitis riparia TaxID=96939 RepID=UPI00155AF3E5|nr:small ubiquitin-related modifier 2-like [Vitis riparia]XP_034686436.1 small ubiquitin-related modifier 2-like [Vitis riparia]XP_034686437.1 small ubiquitin-related modifier 2-like [Vitis riparia]